MKKEGKRRILNYQTKNFLVVIKFPAVVALSLVSLRNRTAGRGRQNVCVWQTWQGYNLHVMSWSPLSINVLWFLQKDLFKGKSCLAKSYFKQNCCHRCHTRFAFFFPLPSCCVSSLFTKSSPQISGSYKCVPVTGVNYFIISPCGFCKHDVRRTTKPLSVDTRVMAPFVFKI